MIKEIVTGIKSLDSLEQEGLDADVEACIYDGPRSELVIIVMYVCQR